MLLTDQQAEGMWCPHVRAVQTFGGDGIAGVNRQVFPQTRGLTNCIGSSCMAWRRRVYDEKGRRLPEPHQGWCGLAGRPDELCD